MGVASTTSISMGKPSETIVIEKRELGHSEGRPFPEMGRFPPFFENDRLVEETDDRILNLAELLYPIGSILVLIL